MTTLTPRELKMIKKLFKEGLSYNEVAEYTGIPKSSVFRAVKEKN